MRRNPRELESYVVLTLDGRAVGRLGPYQTMRGALADAKTMAISRRDNDAANAGIDAMVHTHKEDGQDFAYEVVARNGDEELPHTFVARAVSGSSAAARSGAGYTRKAQDAETLRFNPVDPYEMLSALRAGVGTKEGGASRERPSRLMGVAARPKPSTQTNIVSTLSNGETVYGARYNTQAGLLALAKYTPHLLSAVEVEPTRALLRVRWRNGITTEIFYPSDKKLQAGYAAFSAHTAGPAKNPQIAFVAKGKPVSFFAKKNAKKKR